MFSSITLWDRPTGEIPAIANRLPTVLRSLRIEIFPRSTRTLSSSQAYTVLRTDLKVLTFVGLDFSRPHVHDDNPTAFWADLPEEITTGFVALLQSPSLRTLRLGRANPAQLLRYARSIGELELTSDECDTSVVGYIICGLTNSIVRTKIPLDSLVVSLEYAAPTTISPILPESYYSIFSFEKLRRLSFNWLQGKAKPDLLACCAESLEDLVVAYGYHAHRRCT